MEELKANIEKAMVARRAYYTNPPFKISPHAWNDARNDRGTPRDRFRTETLSHEEWQAAVFGSVELKWFEAQRALLLAEYGLSDNPAPYAVTIKDQPERLGVLFIVKFIDRLSAVDLRRVWDAEFCDDTTAESYEIFRAMHFPTKTIAAWKQRVKYESELPQTPNAYTKITRKRFGQIWQSRDAIFQADPQWQQIGNQRLTRTEVHELLSQIEERLDDLPD